MSDDLIRREAAIDVIENMIFEVWKDPLKTSLLYDARKRIRRIKTVSNNEKIIELLKRLKVTYFLTIANTGDEKLNCAYQHVARALDIAIDIIEKGGFE